MAKLNTGADLFIGQAELNRMMKFMQDDGYVRFLLEQTESFGVIRNEKSDPNFDNFRFVPDSASSVRLARESVALDANGHLVVAKSESIDIPVGAFNLYVAYGESSIEEGSVSISADGELVGVGTEFTKVLRGQPDHPSKIVLSSSNNNAEYTVVEVIDDTHATLFGTFLPEIGLGYMIVGTFTSGYSPQASDKFPFRYDSANIYVTPFAFTPNDYVFHLARVVNNGSSVVVSDRRSQVWKLRAEYKFDTVDLHSNPLVGVDSVKWSELFSPRDKNIVKVDWGFVSDNWTYDSTLRQITINGGVGGRFKSTAQFSNHDFDGWRIYFSNGSYRTVNSSVKSGSQINLLLDVLTDNDVSSAGAVIVVPNVEEVEIEIGLGSQHDENPLVSKVELFPVADGMASIPVIVPSKTSSYFWFKYRYKNNWEYSAWFIPMFDSIGYYDESSFDNDTDNTNPTPDGVLNYSPSDRHRIPYAPSIGGGGYIKLTAHPSSYRNLIDKVYKGDILAVRHRAITNANNVIELKVGRDEQVQIFGGSIGMSVPQLINLSKVGAQNGNKFFVHIKASIVTNGHPFKIVTDYVSIVNHTTVLVIDQSQIDKIDQSGGLVVEAIFDDNGNWYVTGYNELEAGFDGVWDRFTRINNQGSDGSDGLISSNTYTS